MSLTQSCRYSLAVGKTLDPIPEELMIERSQMDWETPDRNVNLTDNTVQASDKEIHNQTPLQDWRETDLLMESSIPLSLL